MEASLSLELEEESTIIPHIHAKRGCGMLCAILEKLDKNPNFSYSCTEFY